MHISEFKGKKVLIVGMAKTGVALAKLLAEQGALVTINDIRSEAELSSALNELTGLWKSSCSCLDESGSCCDESVSCRDESGSCRDDSGKERPSHCPLPPGEREKGTGPCSGFPRDGEDVQPLEYTGGDSSSAASIKSVFGSHPVETFLEQDLILVSPGVPIQQKAFDEARKRNIPISNDLELAFSLTTAPFLAISGTNGKTTTTSLLGDIFERAGKRIIVGGNIGTPLSPLVCERPETEFVIVEVSSFQLETIDRFRPMVGIMLNITPDHLDRYASWDEYVEAKAQLFVNQVAGDFALINATDAATPQLLSIMRDRSSFIDASGSQAAPSTMRGGAGKLLFFSTLEKLAGEGSHSVAFIDARSDYDTGSLPCPCPGLSDASPQPDPVTVESDASSPPDPVTVESDASSSPDPVTVESDASPQPDPVTVEEGRGGPLWPPADGVMIQGNDIVVHLNGMEERICSIEQARLRGEHNRENILAAALTAWLCHIDRSVIQKSIEEFSGLIHRIEFVAEINGVRFIDDSKGTNVDAVVRAIQSIDVGAGPCSIDVGACPCSIDVGAGPCACPGDKGTGKEGMPSRISHSESGFPRAGYGIPRAGEDVQPLDNQNPPLLYKGGLGGLFHVKRKSIWLILGGRDKGNDYLPLVPLVRDRVKGILAIGESREKVNQFFRDIVPVYCADSFKEAVHQGFLMASAGDSVLLSPACASFDMFTSYAHRGQVFKRFVEEIKAGNSGV